MHWCCMFLERLHLAHPLPDTIQNFPIWEYSDIYIRYYYLMSSGFFLISEKCVWHPNFSWVSQCQVFEVPFQGERKSIFQFRNDKKVTRYCFTMCIIKVSKPLIIPLFPERDLDTVFLEKCV